MGAMTIKVVLLEDNQIRAQNLIMTGKDKEELAEQAYDEALKKAKLTRNDIKRVIATGLGRKRVPFADDAITVPSADAKGIVFTLNQGVEIIGMGPREAVRWEKAVEPLFAEYAEDMEKRGLPGKEIVEYTKKMVMKYEKRFK